MKVYFICRKSTNNFMGFETYAQDGNKEYSPKTEWELVEIVEKTSPFNGESYFTETKVWCSVDKSEALNAIKCSKSHFSTEFQYPEHKFDDLEIVEKDI